MTRFELLNNYWRYYLMLENKYLVIEQFIEPVNANFSTYSLELVNVLQSVCSELDVFFKVVCGFNQTDRKSMNDYYAIVNQKYSGLKQQIVRIHGMEIKPFENWNESQPSQSLNWWQAYNDIKHGRVDNFSKATLENVIYALSALYTLEMYYIKEVATASNQKDIPDEESKIFSLKNWKTQYGNMRNMYFQTVGEGVIFNKN